MGSWRYVGKVGGKDRVQRTRLLFAKGRDRGIRTITNNEGEGDRGDGSGVEYKPVSHRMHR